MPSTSDPREVAAIILAGGASRRMGGKNKLLLALRGEPLVRHVARTALASDVRDVIVVSGDDSEAVTKALAGLRLRVVLNTDHAKGMGTSLARGVGALRPNVSAVIVCLGDMPFVAVSSLNGLIDRYRSMKNAPLCVPTYLGQRGNPVLLPERYFAALGRLQDDQGARRLIHEHTDLVEHVAVDDPGILRDIDDRQDWARAMARLGSARGPGRD